MQSTTSTSTEAPAKTSNAPDSAVQGEAPTPQPPLKRNTAQNNNDTQDNKDTNNTKDSNHRRNTSRMTTLVGGLSGRVIDQPIAHPVDRSKSSNKGAFHGAAPVPDDGDAGAHDDTSDAGDEDHQTQHRKRRAVTTSLRRMELYTEMSAWTRADDMMTNQHLTAREVCRH